MHCILDYVQEKWVKAVVYEAVVCTVYWITKKRNGYEAVVCTINCTREMGTRSWGHGLAWVFDEKEMGKKQLERGEGGVWIKEQFLWST